MMKSVTAFAAAVIAAWAFVGSATVADARCTRCGPIKPSYVYKTVKKVSHRTVYRNVTKTRYVQRIRRIVHVKRVQPIVRIHQVTRIHHRTVAKIRNVHVSRTQVLPAKVYRTSSVKHSYGGCGCR